MGKFYSIDPQTCTLDELRSAIRDCELKEEFYTTMEQACKIFINSIYGAIGSSYYNCANVSIAESITLQGQDLIKYSVRMIDYYFKELWHKDEKAHAEIARRMKEKYPDFDDAGFVEAARSRLQFGDTLQVYGDTDSAYLSLQNVIDACGITYEQSTDFDLIVNAVVLDDYLPKVFDKYAQMYNCPKNLELFELEKIARTLIMLAKKKYVFECSWKEPDVHVAPLHSIIYKGIEVIQGSVPQFCRDLMTDFIKFVLSNSLGTDKIPYNAILTKLKDIKAKFSMTSPNDISKSLNIGDYEKYILNDKGKTGVVFTGMVCPMHVRAAANYNNMLYNKAKRYKSKYSFIKKGDKVKFYYTDNDNVFAFIPDEYPVEFAPKMDMDNQFQKMILDPINRIIEAAGYREVNSNLVYSPGLW